MIDPNDVVKNRLLLLTLLTKVSEMGKVYGIVKEQKVAHKLQHQLRETGRSGLTYTFVKDDMGPRSTGVYYDIDALVSAGFWSDEKHKPTREGKKLVEKYNPFLEAEENREIWDTILEVASEYGPLTPGECKELAYSFQVDLRGERVPMLEVKKGTVVLRPYRGRKLYLSKTQLATLRFEFDEDAKKQLSLAIDRCRSEPASSKPWKEVLS